MISGNHNGIFLASGVNGAIVGNVICNSDDGSGNGNGILFNSTLTNTLVAYNHIFDDQGTPTQSRGMVTNGSNPGAGTIIAGNHVHDNVNNSYLFSSVQTDTIFSDYPQGTQDITTRVVTASGAITHLATDSVIIVNKTTGAATAITLIASPALGRIIRIKDGKGDANTNNITITPAAGNIDGSATKVINTAFGALSLIYNGTQWNSI